MNNFIIYEPKEVKAKGISEHDIINKNKLKSYFFEEDYENLELLNQIEIPFDKDELTVLYPGAGADMFFPLIYLEKLFPGIKTINLIFVDIDNNLGSIKYSLDSIGVSFSEYKNSIKFYWKDQLINLNYISQNINQYLQENHSFDIYFEKNFRIMKEQIFGYEDDIIKKLNINGIIISDSGFVDKKLKEIKVPKRLSSYDEMVIAIKKK